MVIINTINILEPVFISNMDYDGKIGGYCQMKLSSGWEQSVYVLLILSRLPENRSLNSLSLAERLEVSHSYLKKIIKSLVNEGLIRSLPGKNGGFCLETSLDTIDFYKIFVAIEGRGKIFASQHLLRKFLGKEGDEAQRCAITDALDAIEDNLISTLSAVTLQQVAKEIQKNYRLADLDEWIEQNIDR